MDKNAIKKYAVWARRELISRVSHKAAFYGITDTDHGTVGVESVDERVLTAAEKKQRDALIHQIQKDGYEQTIEEVAYTWFNRFSALRYMEVNGYLPTHVRVFTDDTGALKPQILTEAINLELDGLDMQKVYDLKNSNQDEALYRYLLITQCNALNAILPGMFQKIEDYTELLLPDNLLREGSVIEQMVTTIPEEDWTDQVQIIGWLYQYYNVEPKDKVFAALKKNVKITKENIPAATQLFTPDWIVRYMVENSLGRLWLEGHPDVKNQLLPTEDEQSAYAAGKRDPEDTKWHYYLEEAEQEPEVQVQLAEIRKEYAALTPEQLKVIDPCMGSGHILVYMFDVLVKIYEAYGYSARDAVKSIIENNLYGLDIDDRAAQLAYFAVMMKARQYDRRFFSRGIQPHVYAITESNGINRNQLQFFGWLMGDAERNKALTQVEYLLDTFRDAKEYGSILNIDPMDWALLYCFAGTVDYSDQISMDQLNLEDTKDALWTLIEQGAVLTQRYDVVVTNPPYMAVSNAGVKVNDYVKKNFPDSKADMFAVFIERCGQMAKKNGYQAMITQHAWMFLSSFEKLRTKLLAVDIVNMAHLGARAFEEIGGEVVQTTSFVIRKSHTVNYKGEYCRLTGQITQQSKEKMFLAMGNRFIANQSSFSIIPGNPLAYWIAPNAISIFETGKRLSEYAEITRGLTTGNNDLYLRFWHEINICDFSSNATSVQQSVETGKKWFPHNKGGEYRTWYGNNDLVVFFENAGEKLHQYYQMNKAVRFTGMEHYFEEGITWSALTTGKNTFRYSSNHIFDSNKGPMLFTQGKRLYYMLGFLNSCVLPYFVSVLNPSLSLQNADMDNLPYIEDSEFLPSVDALSRQNVNIAKFDWDSFETSWDFARHPLVEYRHSVSKVNATDSWYIKNVFDAWEYQCQLRFDTLKNNEQELNRTFIGIYGLQDELTPEVEDKDVTVRKADLGRDIRSFLSYAVGCMFGRYSLDVDGLAYAGGNYDSKYCRWIRRFGDKATEEIDENGNLIHGVWAGCTLWEYDGVRKDGKWIPASFAPDTDNIIPICDDEYFDDDIVGRFVEFVKTVYGEDTLDENLKFIADALGGKGAPKEVIRNYFLNDFYADHCKIYQKRPIYWLFDSGKKNGFKALIYIHRYREDTIARIRTDYVHEQQGRYRTAIADLESRIANADTGSRVKLTKQLTKLQSQAEELRVYEEKIHHLADQMIRIDLDDGVKHNYEIFKDVLAKIK